MIADPKKVLGEKEAAIISNFFNNTVPEPPKKTEQSTSQDAVKILGEREAKSIANILAAASPVKQESLPHYGQQPPPGNEATSEGDDHFSWFSSAMSSVELDRRNCILCYMFKKAFGAEDRESVEKKIAEFKMKEKKESTFKKGDSVLVSGDDPIVGTVVGLKESKVLVKTDEGKTISVDSEYVSSVDLDQEVLDRIVGEEELDVDKMIDDLLG